MTDKPNSILFGPTPTSPLLPLPALTTSTSTLVATPTSVNANDDSIGCLTKSHVNHVTVERSSIINDVFILPSTTPTSPSIPPTVTATVTVSPSSLTSTTLTSATSLMSNAIDDDENDDFNASFAHGMTDQQRATVHCFMATSLPLVCECLSVRRLPSFDLR
jgi:hypothetical protein